MKSESKALANNHVSSNEEGKKDLPRDLQYTNQQNMDRMKERMREVLEMSPTMCTAKWLQSTLHLHNGFTHSCHHPVPHKIPLKELSHPSALHNTEFKKKQRKSMLDGQRPKECDYCWKIEDLGKDFFSDRTYKSANQDWSMPFLQRVREAGANGNIDPSYVEISFSNACNFKCVYCSPEISSKWMEEVKQHGSVKLTGFDMHDLDYLKSSGKFPYDVNEENPYVEHFWKWWPELYNSLHTFRITGGEPLLSKDTWKVFDYIKKHPRKDLSIAINTNLGVSTPLVDKLIKEYNEVSPNVKEFAIYTSLESTGAQAEFTRFGLQYEQFLINVNRLLSETPCRLNFMVTFNILSMSTFEDFIREICNIRRNYNSSGALNRIPVMISYLRWPEMLNVQVAPPELKRKYAQDYINLTKEFRAENLAEDDRGFLYLEEIDQIERLCEYMLKDVSDESLQRKDFTSYIRQMETRRNLNFSETFPELQSMILV
ncbi:MAG: radical SAM protein [Bdellovibrionales bacterium]|nr:twitch domain-containing radical SAM protein [Bdellovibrionales bacterium]NQZ18283.1 radical SAM protein [Bdellovibrionales bacterium]